VRAALRQLFLASTGRTLRRRETTSLEVLIPSADLDEQRLERAVGRFMAHHLGPAATTDAEMFAALWRLVPEHGLSVPPDVAAVFRCLATWREP